jgi:hypothetical protein
MTRTLILKKTASHYGEPWTEDDCVVLDADQIIGRIMLHPQAPKGRSWFWTIRSHPRLSAIGVIADKYESALKLYGVDL